MKIAAVVLAAGASERIGNENKLLLPVGERPMIITSLETVIQAGFSPVVVVLGADEQRLREALEGCDVSIVLNREWNRGLSSSIKAGIESLSADVAGALITLADMPLIKPATLGSLREIFTANRGDRIVFPTYNGRQGNPVIFPTRLFPELLQLSGDRGAKPLLKKYAQSAVAVPVDSPEVLMDCDTREDYHRILSYPRES